MKNRPLVSIIINNYNYERFLEDALSSVFAQTYDDLEIVVVDDGSTDNSLEIIKNYERSAVTGKSSIKTIFKENGGQASAFNAGFAASKGEIICFLDSDDTFAPHKVAKIVEIFLAHKDIGWCFHSLILEDHQTKEFLGVNAERGTRKCDFRKVMQRGKLPFFGSPTSGLCFRRSLLKQILPMTESLRRGADRYLVAFAPALSPGYYLDERLANQKIHGKNGNTFQVGKKFARRRAFKALTVAYFMKSKLPEFRRFSDRVFSRGLSLYWQAEFQPPEQKELIDRYLSTVNLVSKIKIYFMALYQNQTWKRPKLEIPHKQEIFKTKS